MTTENEYANIKSENAVNLALQQAGCHPHTIVEWSDDIGQTFLNVERVDYRKFETIKAIIKAEGYNLDEFVNGHGFIRPVSIGHKLDLRLPYWTYSLWR